MNQVDNSWRNLATNKTNGTQIENDKQIKDKIIKNFTNIIGTIRPPSENHADISG